METELQNEPNKLHINRYKLILRAARKTNFINKTQIEKKQVKTFVNIIETSKQCNKNCINTT